MERRFDSIEIMDADGNLAPAPAHCPVECLLQPHDREDGLLVERDIPYDRRAEIRTYRGEFWVDGKSDP